MQGLLSNSEQWMISNRQPWVYALTQGWITSKTRSPNVYLPPVGATVFLHASKAIWSDWRCLPWCQDIDVNELPRGGIVAMATLAETGATNAVMPVNDHEFFECQWSDIQNDYRWNCAQEVTMRFENIASIPFIACRGVRVPTRKLPIPLVEWIGTQGI